MYNYTAASRSSLELVDRAAEAINNPTTISADDMTNSPDAHTTNPVATQSPGIFACLGKNICGKQYNVGGGGKKQFADYKAAAIGKSPYERQAMRSEFSEPNNTEFKIIGKFKTMIDFHAFEITLPPDVRCRVEPRIQLNMSPIEVGTHVRTLRELNGPAVDTSTNFFVNEVYIDVDKSGVPYSPEYLPNTFIECQLAVGQALPSGEYDILIQPSSSTSCKLILGKPVTSVSVHIHISRTDKQPIIASDAMKLKVVLHNRMTRGGLFGGFDKLRANDNSGTVKDSQSPIDSHLSKVAVVNYTIYTMDGVSNESIQKAIDALVLFGNSTSVLEGGMSDANMRYEVSLMLSGLPGKPTKLFGTTSHYLNQFSYWLSGQSQLESSTDNSVAIRSSTAVNRIPKQRVNVRVAVDNNRTTLRPRYSPLRVMDASPESINLIESTYEMKNLRTLVEAVMSGETAGILGQVGSSGDSSKSYRLVNPTHFLMNGKIWLDYNRRPSLPNHTIVISDNGHVAVYLKSFRATCEGVSLRWTFSRSAKVDDTAGIMEDHRVIITPDAMSLASGLSYCLYRSKPDLYYGELEAYPLFVERVPFGTRGSPFTLHAGLIPHEVIVNNQPIVIDSYVAKGGGGYRVHERTVNATPRRAGFFYCVPTNSLHKLHMLNVESYQILVVAEGPEKAMRLAELLSDYPQVCVASSGGKTHMTDADAKKYYKDLALGGIRVILVGDDDYSDGRFINSALSVKGTMPISSFLVNLTQAQLENNRKIDVEDWTPEQELEFVTFINHCFECNQKYESKREIFATVTEAREAQHTYIQSALSSLANERIIGINSGTGLGKTHATVERIMEERNDSFAYVVHTTAQAEEIMSRLTELNKVSARDDKLTRSVVHVTSRQSKVDGCALYSPEELQLRPALSCKDCESAGVCGYKINMKAAADAEIVVLTESMLQKLDYSVLGDKVKWLNGKEPTQRIYIFDDTNYGSEGKLPVIKPVSQQVLKYPNGTLALDVAKAEQSESKDIVCDWLKSKGLKKLSLDFNSLTSVPVHIQQAYQRAELLSQLILSKSSLLTFHNDCLIYRLTGPGYSINHSSVMNRLTPKGFFNKYGVEYGVDANRDSQGDIESAFNEMVYDRLFELRREMLENTPRTLVLNADGNPLQGDFAKLLVKWIGVDVRTPNITVAHYPTCKGKKFSTAMAATEGGIEKVVELMNDASVMSGLAGHNKGGGWGYCVNKALKIPLMNLVGVRSDLIVGFFNARASNKMTEVMNMVVAWPSKLGPLSLQSILWEIYKEDIDVTSSLNMNTRSITYADIRAQLTAERLQARDIMQAIGRLRACNRLDKQLKVVYLGDTNVTLFRMLRLVGISVINPTSMPTTSGHDLIEAIPFYEDDSMNQYIVDMFIRSLGDGIPPPNGLGDSEYQEWAKALPIISFEDDDDEVEALENLRYDDYPPSL